ncbi:MAG: hypothetical protein WAX80_03555 [Minisyncoccia bacterium]
MKKVTLFVDRGVQEALYQNPEWLDAYLIAMKFWYILVANGSTGFRKRVRWSDPEPDCRGDGAGYIKFICGNHSESGRMQELFEKSYRIEGRFSFCYGPKYLILDITGHERGEKKPRPDMSFSFPKEHAEHSVASPLTFAERQSGLR